MNLWCRFCASPSSLSGHPALLHVSHLQLLQSCLQLHRVCTGPLHLDPTLQVHTHTHTHTHKHVSLTRRLPLRNGSPAYFPLGLKNCQTFSIYEFIQVSLWTYY